MPHAYHSASDLPETFAVFPLPGAILLPRWQLPLNIFEPRYLNMIDDAMAGTKLIGMIQSFGGDRAHPVLANIGCIGRITGYSETNDGRYLLTLVGLARFRIVEELEVRTPYRQVRGSFQDYAEDFDDPDIASLPPRLRLEAALQIYADTNGFGADWEAISEAPIENLINGLVAGLPFQPIDKQALIEAKDLKMRCETLIKILSMAPDGSNNESGPL